MCSSRLSPKAVPLDPGGSVQSVCGSRLRSRGRWNVHRAGTDARCEMLTLLLRCAALGGVELLNEGALEGSRRSSSLDCTLHGRGSRSSSNPAPALPELVRGVHELPLSAVCAPGQALQRSH